jgi:hypothetical protein
MVRKKQDVQVAISALLLGKRDAFLTKIKVRTDRGIEHACGFHHWLRGNFGSGGGRKGVPLKSLRSQKMEEEE